ncbi:MAG: beta-CASP ribonuclease aCPSF1 [Nitrososphaerota archaeon]|nr:beta-CASP ribonuclease aCPSF1 [Candidatus Calditenuaceae archaeon]MDW8073126.1 beta-CASP ribonuclease aCPSF1 [Nitrososphaerota archaeon]
MLSKLRADIFNYLVTLGRGERIVTRIDFEGPKIVIYTAEPSVFAERNSVARDLVNLIKKRVVIRPDESLRVPPDEAKRILKEALSGFTVNIVFDNLMGEAIVESNDQELFNFLTPERLAALERQLNWIIVPSRAPIIPSRTVEKLKKYLYGDGEERVEILRRIGERIFREQLFEPGEVSMTILGGGMQVGRSAILVRTRESCVLMDFGISAGASKTLDMLPRIDFFPDLVDVLDAVIITHSHMDHHGALPLLFKYGYRGPVYMTEPTLPLMVMEHLDYLNLAAKTGQYALYSEREVRLAARHVVPLRYGVVTNITPDIRVTFYNAGHILGSAIAHLHIGEGFHNIVYTGDFKYEKTRMLDPATSRFPRMETLIIESTYGATPVPFTREQTEQIFAEHITRTVNNGGSVLIPVPAVGRAQEIMLVIKNLIESKMIPETPVILDGLLIESTSIYSNFPEYYSAESKDEFIRGDSLFFSDYFVNVKSQSHREEILASREPMIVLATSGMLEGGPALSYLRALSESEKNLLLFVSYQVEGTLGRKILKGSREITLINEEGRQEVFKLSMSVEKVDGFSGHSSRQQTLSYLKRVSPKPQNVIFVHGEPEAVNSVAGAARRIVEGAIYSPRNLDTIVVG